MSEKAQSGVKRQLSHAVAWNVLFTPIKLLVDTIANIIKINLLSKAEVGVLSFISSAASSVGIWVDLGIDQTLPKFIPEVERSAGQGAVRTFLRRIITFKMLVLLLALLAIPLWGGALLQRMHNDVNTLVDKHVSGDVIGSLQIQLDRYGWFFLGAVAALLVLGSLYDTLRAYLTSFFRQKAWNIITMLGILMLPVLSASAVLLGLGTMGVVGAMVLTAVISVLITWTHVSKALRQQQQIEQRSELPAGTWKRFAPYVLLSASIGISDYFSSQYFSVYWMKGLEQAASYWVAYSLIKQLQSYVYTPMNGIQVPLLTRVRAEGDQRLERVFGTLIRLLILLLVPSGLLLVSFLHNFVLVQFPTYNSAIPAALMLIPFLFLEPFWGVGQNVLMVHERYSLVLISRALSLSSIPLLIVLVPPLGLIGAVLATGLSRTFAGLFALGFTLRSYRLHLPWRFAGKVFGAGLITLAVTAPLMWLASIAPGVEEIGQRALYALLTLGVGGMALVVLVVCLRVLHILQPEDRALLAEIRHPLAQRLQKLL